MKNKVFFCFLLICRSYDVPQVTDEMLQVTSKQFACGVIYGLCSQWSAPVYVSIDSDVWRYIVSGKGIPSEQCGHTYLRKMILTNLNIFLIIGGITLMQMEMALLLTSP